MAFICKPHRKKLLQHKVKFPVLFRRVMGNNSSQYPVYENVATEDPTTDTKLQHDGEDILRYSADPTAKEQIKPTETLAVQADDNGIYGNHVMIKLVASMKDIASANEENLEHHLKHAEQEHAELEQLPIAPAVPQPQTSVCTNDTIPVPSAAKGTSIIKRLSKRLTKKISVKKRTKKRDECKLDRKENYADISHEEEGEQESNTKGEEPVLYENSDFGVQKEEKEHLFKEKGNKSDTVEINTNNTKHFYDDASSKERETLNEAINDETDENMYENVEFLKNENKSKM